MSDPTIANLFSKFNDFSLPVIQIPFKSKGPNMKSWQRFCETLPSPSEVAAWDRLAAVSPVNYGLCLGPSSKIVAVDIDTDNPRILDLVPQSPIRKRGKKGETRFFRYNPAIKAQKYHTYGVEILSTGNQTIIPPSVHPDGMQYQWLTPFDLTSHVDLPELDMSFLERLHEVEPTFSITNTGRNTKLVEMASAKLTRGEVLSDIAQALLDYDTRHHTPPLFSDRKDVYSKTWDRPEENAQKLVTSVQSSLIRGGVMVEPKPDMTPEISVEDVIARAQARAAARGKEKPWPRGRGMMEMFQAHCELLNDAKIDALSLGGAVGFMAGLASNRIMTEQFVGRFTTPNLYALTVGASGLGKDKPLKLATRLLSDTGVLGSMGYKSSTALLMTLAEQQECLSIMDEASSLLRAISTGEGYQQEISDVLCNLYSSAQDQFDGVASAGNKTRFGACYFPHFSILAATTPHSMSQHLNREMSMTGLMPRFMVFHQRTNEGQKIDLASAPFVVEAYKHLQAFVSHVEKQMPKREATGRSSNPKMGKLYAHRLVKLDTEATDYFQTAKEHWRNIGFENPHDFRTPFQNRFVENALKLSLLDWLGNQENWLGREEHDFKPIGIEGALWGMQVVLKCWENTEDLFETSSSENKHEALITKMMKYIRESGAVSRNDLYNRFRAIPVRYRDDCLRQLREMGVIKQEALRHEKGAGRPSEMYLWIGD